MSGFHIHETVRYLDGKEVERIQRTTCSECGADLRSAEDWSRHRSMHTVIPPIVAQCRIPKEFAK